MVTIATRKVIVQCGCGRDWVWPSEPQCPFCGETVDFQFMEDVGALPFTDRSGSSDHDRGDEIDSWARSITITGLLICLLITLLAVWDGLLLADFLKSTGLPPGLHQPVRWGLVLAGALGTLKSILSLLAWRSGSYWYRRIRRWN